MQDLHIHDIKRCDAFGYFGVKFPTMEEVTVVFLTKPVQGLHCQLNIVLWNDKIHKETKTKTTTDPVRSLNHHSQLDK